MSEQAEEMVDDTGLPAPEVENEAVTPETEPGEVSDQGEEEEVVITIGEESPPQEEETKGPAPAWVKDLRKAHREAQKKIRELESKLHAPEVPNVPTVGPKPTLEACDYDSDKLANELEKWVEQKRKADEVKSKAEQERLNQQKAWEAQLAAYEEKKKSLKVADYEEAEAHVQETFDVTQQGIMIQGLENPAKVIFALGKNPKKAAELAAIKDPVKFAIAVGKLETQVKEAVRKPAPERVVTGTGGVSGAVSDSKLEALKEEARRTGNWDKYYQAKRAKGK